MLRGGGEGLVEEEVCLEPGLSLNDAAGQGRVSGRDVGVVLFEI